MPTTRSAGKRGADNENPAPVKKVRGQKPQKKEKITQEQNKEKAQKEKLPKEKPQKEKSEKDKPQKEKLEKEKPVKEKQSKEQTKKEKSENEKAETESLEGENASTIYEFTVNDINGEPVALDKYKGHVCIIVNVASRCGHTKSNYEQFVQLHEDYAESKGLKILAFPCNQFGSQEPGDSAKILKFAKDRNVEFDMFEKIAVNGANAHPLWNFLKNKIPDDKGVKNIKWNFTKFIVDKEGKPVKRFVPSTKPLKLIENLQEYW